MKQKKELHVVYIVTQLELGGAQKVCISLLKNVPSHHIKTFLIAGNYGPLTDRVKALPGVTLIKELYQGKKQINFWREIRAFFALIQQLKILKKKYPNLIVHTHSSKAGFLGRWAAFFSGIKERIHTIHGYAFHAHSPWLIWCIIYACEYITSYITTHFVCVSSHDVKTGIRLLPGFAKKYTIIRAAVDTTMFNSARTTHMPSTQSFCFGTISCFKKQKNIFDLLAAFKSVHTQHPQARLEIIGDGFLRTAIEAWIQHNKLADSITLLGWQDDVRPYLQRWHAFVLSSLWEGLPCAIVEARLHKLPIICYNTGGITDIIFHGINGLIAPQGDRYMLTRYMQEIIINPKRYHQLHECKDDLQDFSPTAMAYAHAQLYKHMTKL